MVLSAPLAAQKTSAPEGRDATSAEFSEELERLRLLRERRREAVQETHRRLREENAKQKREYVSLLDPQLDKAWRYFADRENRRRETAIKLFEQYLADHPDTLFKAEIYGRIGQLYSSHRRSENNEDYRPDLMAKYYELAHGAYGSQYSDANMTVWGSVINQPSPILADRLEYYDWLRGFDTANADQIDPIVAMGIAAKGFRDSVEWSKQERQMQAEHLKKQLPLLMQVTEENIVSGSGLDDLRRIMELYPGTNFAAMAQAKQKAILGRTLAASAEQHLNDPSFLTSTADAAPIDQPQLVQPETATGPLARLAAKESASIATRDTDGGRFAPLIAAAAVLVLLMFVVLINRRRLLKD